jgi:DNA-directed RNA polymerase subunit RPC12/RpoP
MSSFRANPNAKSYKCVYCTKQYSPGTQPNKGIRCPQCHLWQPRASMMIVSQSSRFTPKQIHRIFVISLKSDRERWEVILIM